METLKNEVLEGKIEVNLEFIRRKARGVVQQFREHPSIVPNDGITLCGFSDARVMGQLRDALHEELALYGYKIPLVPRNEEHGYSILVDDFLGIKGNGRG